MNILLVMFHGRSMCHGVLHLQFYCLEIHRMLRRLLQISKYDNNIPPPYLGMVQEYHDMELGCMSRLVLTWLLHIH